MKKQNTMTYIAVLGLFLFSGAATFMNAAMQTMIDAHPDIAPTTIRLIGTLPSVISTFVMMLVGAIVGKLISYRLAAIVGSLLIFVCGTLPAFIHEPWASVLVLMSALGVGVGFIGIRNALIIKLIPEERQADFIGYGMLLMNVGVGISGPVVGYLARGAWNNVFFFNTVTVIPLLLTVFFLPEPGAEETKQTETVSDSEIWPVKKMNWRTYLYPILQVVYVILLYPLLSGISTFLAGKNLGDAMVAGTVITVYTVFGAVVGVLVGPVQKRLGHLALPVVTILSAVSLAMIVFAPNIAMVFVGTAFAGLFTNFSPSFFQLYNGRVTPPARVAFFSTLIVAAMQLGIFVSNYYISFCHTIFNRSSDVESALFCSIFGFAALGIFGLLISIAPKES